MISNSTLKVYPAQLAYPASKRQLLPDFRDVFPSGFGAKEPYDLGSGSSVINPSASRAYAYAAAPAPAASSQPAPITLGRFSYTPPGIGNPQQTQQFNQIDKGFDNTLANIPVLGQLLKAIANVIPGHNIKLALMIVLGGVFTIFILFTQTGFGRRTPSRGPAIAIPTISKRHRRRRK